MISGIDLEDRGKIWHHKARALDLLCVQKRRKFTFNYQSLSLKHFFNTSFCFVFSLKRSHTPLSWSQLHTQTPIVSERQLLKVWCTVRHHLLPSGAGSLRSCQRIIMKSAMIVGSRAIHTMIQACKPTKYRSHGACDVNASTTASTTGLVLGEERRVVKNVMAKTKHKTA